MAKQSNEPLQPNPFLTYRDSKTGLWLVIQIQENATMEGNSALPSQENATVNLQQKREFTFHR